MQAYEATQDVCITIFAHGIMSVKPHLLNNIFNFITDTVENTRYQGIIRDIRNDSFLYNGQAMQSQGLKRISLDGPLYDNGARAIATLFDYTSKRCPSQADTLHHYYTFGWSGLFSPQARKKAAQALYDSLEPLIAHYTKKYNSKPKIRIIGYSHGANMVAALGSLSEVNPDVVWVDELILLGMPVHKIEHYWLHSPLFKHIYHVYSYSDHVQYLDIFTHLGHFASKQFKNYRRLKLPHNLTQIELKVTRPARGTRKNKSAYYHKSGIFSGKARCLRDASPGHIELWFLGWAAELYRKDFILYPIPYVAFLPCFLEQVNRRNHIRPIRPARPVIIDVRPYDERMIIRDKNSYHNVTVVPFFSEAEINELKSMASLAQPVHYTLHAHMERADSYLT